MRNSKPRLEQLAAAYNDRYEAVLKPLAHALEAYISGYFRDLPRIDRITARAKAVDRFMAKARKREKRGLKYDEPLYQIQDQIGARIVTFYRSDVDSLDKIVKKYFTPIEFKDHVPDSEWEFGYFGRHYVLILPTDVISDDMETKHIPKFFELQVKTLFQHAWSEAGHDLGYKPGEVPLTPGEKRRLAYTSAQAWGADHIFDELARERQVTPGTITTPFP